MERTKIAAIFADSEQLGGREVLVCGWARTIRDMKTFGFIELNDGSCFKNLQVVIQQISTSPVNGACITAKCATSTTSPPTCLS